MSKPRNPVWKVYDLVADGVTVYVGCSRSPAARRRAHIKRGIVGEDAVLVIVSKHRSDWYARRAEGRRIRKLRPVHNIRGNETIIFRQAVNEMLVSMGKAGLQLGSPATARRTLGKRPRKKG